MSPLQWCNTWTLPYNGVLNLGHGLVISRILMFEGYNSCTSKKKILIAEGTLLMSFKEYMNFGQDSCNSKILMSEKGNSTTWIVDGHNLCPSMNILFEGHDSCTWRKLMVEGHDSCTSIKIIDEGHNSCTSMKIMVEGHNSCTSIKITVEGHKSCPPREVLVEETSS